MLKNEWKAIRLNVGSDPAGPLALFHLESDPQEKNDVAALHPDLVAEFAKAMKEARIPSDVFNFGISSK